MCVVCFWGEGLTSAITAEVLKKVMNLPGISSDVLEYLVDTSVDILNTFSGAGIANMSGNSGTKMLSLTSEKRGAVMLVVRAVYYGFFKDLTGRTVGDISVQPADLLSNPQVMKTLELVASRLSPAAGATGSAPEVNVRRG